MGALFFVVPRIQRHTGGKPVRSIKRHAGGSPVQALQQLGYDGFVMRYSVRASTPGKVIRSVEPPGEALAGNSQVSAYRAQIRECLESEDFQGARNLLATALREHPEEPALRKLEQALAPPEIRATPELDQDRTEELRWLEHEGNAGAYQGKWIALLGVQVVAVADTLKALLALLHADPPARTPLIHKVV